MVEIGTAEPGDLDALLAAPEHHVLLFENDQVRMLDIAILPGPTVPLHTHCWPGTLYLMSWSECVRRNAHGAVLMDSRTLVEKPAVGSAWWSPPMEAHTLENVGTAVLRLISTEVKTGTASKTAG